MAPRKKRESAPPMAVTFRPVGELVPYAKNARTHSLEQIAQIAASMAEFGFTNPVLTDAHGGIVAGHGRVLGAKAAWDAGKDIPRCPRGRVPVIELGHLTEEQRRAYILADNKIALNAGWDMGLLQSELAALSNAEFNIGLTGFGQGEIEQILAWVAPGQGLTDPDDAPPLPAEPVTHLGDVWLCGRHRVLCGDSTSASDVAALLNGGEPLLMVTDPPYGVDYDPDWRNRADRANGKPYGARAVGLVQNDGRVDWREAWALFPGEVAYCWHAGRHASSVQASLEAAGFEVRCQIIWAKPRHIISRGHYHWQHEPCWYAVKHGGKGHWQGDRSQTTLWSIEHLKSETGHGTQKPVEAMRRPILNNSSPGQAVYDPFLGSGTTLIAADMEGRICYGMEISPAYCDVIVRRWQDFTGKKATLESDGSEFPAVDETDGSEGNRKAQGGSPELQGDA